MPSKRTLAPFGVVAVGVALLAVGLAGVVDGPVTTALVGTGFLVVFAGALWYDVLDGRPLSEVGRDDLLVGALLLVGWGGYLVVTTDLELGRTARMGIGLLGAAAILGVGYLRQHRATVDSYDEREIRIRYRAAYNAFLATVGLLFLGSFGTYLATTAPGDTGPTYATAIVFASVALMAFGVLAFKLSEGWYQTRM